MSATIDIARSSPVNERRRQWVHDKNYHDILSENHKNKNIWYLAHTNLVQVHHLMYFSTCTFLFLTIGSGQMNDLR
jgi:hypothetical protein